MPRSETFEPELPIDENGKEIPPDPRDPRFNPDGTLKDDFKRNTTVRRAVKNPDTTRKPMTSSFTPSWSQR